MKSETDLALLPPLQMETVLRYEVDTDDFTKFVRAFFNNSDYEYEADMETGREHVLRTSVFGTLDASDKEKIEKMEKFQQWNFSAHAFLEYFASLDLIPKGDYVLYTY